MQWPITISWVKITNRKSLKKFLLFQDRGWHSLLISRKKIGKKIIHQGKKTTPGIFSDLRTRANLVYSFNSLKKFNVYNFCFSFLYRSHLYCCFLLSSSSEIFLYHSRGYYHLLSFSSLERLFYWLQEYSCFLFFPSSLNSFYMLITSILMLYYFFFFRKILIVFTCFSLQYLFGFFDNMFLPFYIYIYIYIYVYKERDR